MCPIFQSSFSFFRDVSRHIEHHIFFERSSEPKADIKKSFVWKLFGPCEAGKHHECDIELAMYRCSCKCHRSKPKAIGRGKPASG
jgi:hypothetical protein